MTSSFNAHIYLLSGPRNECWLCAVLVLVLEQTHMYHPYLPGRTTNADIQHHINLWVSRHCFFCCVLFCIQIEGILLLWVRLLYSSQSVLLVRRSRVLAVPFFCIDGSVSNTHEKPNEINHAWWWQTPSLMSSLVLKFNMPTFYYAYPS